MSVEGALRSLELRMASQSLEPSGPVFITEDLVSGSRLRVDVDAEAVHDLRVGSPVSLDLTPAEASEGGRATFSLWCRLIEVRQDGSRALATVEAADPLGFCADEPQFRTYAGGGPFLRLADRVLAYQPGRLQGCSASQGESSQLPQEWLLQCNETGRTFLQRVARSVGSVVFWRRSELVSAEIGKGPASPMGPAELRLGEGLLEMSVVRGPDLGPRRVLWTDPETRKVQNLRFDGRGLDGGASTPGLAGRSSSRLRPKLPAHFSEELIATPGSSLHGRSKRPDLSLGAEVRLAGGTTAVISHIEHRVDGLGHYHNQFVAIPPSRWGLEACGRIPASLLGPFQAEVTYNADPHGLGRVRVTLTEDAERRSSQWLSPLPPFAGHERGLYWIPEIGDLVLVVAPAECPENLHVLGSIRGTGQKPKPAWRSDTNAIKAIAAKRGLCILLDEEEGVIRLETRKASIEIRDDGEIRLAGDKLTVEIGGKVDLQGSGGVKIDGPRIDLG